MARLALALLTITVAAAQTPDLTGRWNGNNGASYYIRQTGNRLYWVGLSSDNGQSFTNVFEATINGTRITGSWADVPLGRIMQNGTLTLQIVSANRLTGGGVNFGATEWTRPGSANPAPPRPADPSANISGNWVDSQGLRFSVVQSGGNLNFTGPQGWTPGTGAFTSDRTFTMTWPGRGTYDATVANNNRVEWAVGEVWTRPGSANISGNWVDSQGLRFSVTQRGGNLDFTGPQGWTPGTGAFTSDRTFTMTWPGSGTYNATVANNNRVEWAVGEVWTRR